MIFKDKWYKLKGLHHKEIKQRLEYLYSLILTMARIQKIHPTILQEESRNMAKNLQYMIDMVEKKEKK